MNYANLLRHYIKESKLTLDEISNRLKDHGITATKQYLSKLQNGKTPPASDKLNEALAEITKGDNRQLQWAAFIEKAPEDIKEFFSYMDSPLMTSIVAIEEKFPGFMKGKYKGRLQEINNSLEYKIIQEVFKKYLDQDLDDSFNSHDLEVIYEDPLEWPTMSREELEELYKEEFPATTTKVISINLYEAYLDHAKKTINKLQDKELNQITIYNALSEAFNALELRLNRVISNALIKSGVDQSWISDYLAGLSLKNRLDSALKMHLRYDITSENFYTELMESLKIKDGLLEGHETLTKKEALHVIRTIEVFLDALNKKNQELKLD